MHSKITRGAVPPSATSDAARTHGRPLPASGNDSRSALCLWLPTFELRLELVRTPELDGTSVALLEPGTGGRRSVWQVSARARNSGVEPGQIVSRAVALCPGLTLLEPDPAHYDAAEAAIIEALAGVSPVVEPAGPGRVYLGMDGLERLFGPPAHQIRMALSALEEVLPTRMVAAVRAGMAPGRFGAWVAAVSARSGAPVAVAEGELASFLAPKPIRALPLDGRMIARLERLEVTTLGDLRRLPAPALATQFGPDGVKALGWATGRRIDPVRPVHRPRPIRAVIDFPEPVGTEATLHVALERLIERALARPERRGRGVLGARMGARLEGGGSWLVSTVLRESEACAGRIASPLKAKMALSPPPCAVDTLMVELTNFGAPHIQAGLFATANGGKETGGGSLARGEPPTVLTEAVRELRLRLGHDPLFRVVEVEPWSRIPERHYALMAFDPA